MRTEIVRSLKEIAHPSAVPGLVREFNDSDKENWNLDYGSDVVAALHGMGTPPAKAAIGSYADRLAARIPDDPLAKKYFEDKIAEARNAASEMK